MRNVQRLVDEFVFEGFVCDVVYILNIYIYGICLSFMALSLYASMTSLFIYEWIRTVFV